MSQTRVAVVGVGYSTVGRKTTLTWQDLVIEAVSAALDDSGLRPADIDGMTTMGGSVLSDAAMLGIGPLSWFDQDDFGPAFIQPAAQAVAAIQAGQCHTCIAVRVIKKGTFAPAVQSNPLSADGRVGGDLQFCVPYGIGGPWWAALMARRHMVEYGTTEEQFGAHVMAQRRFAALNEDALLRSEISLDEYMASRYICTPIRLLDCDYPCDAGAAVIFTTEERAADLAQRPVFVESYALSASGEPSFENLPDLTNQSPLHSAELLWSRTDLKPQDVDCAQLYDGFTIITFEWLEALGFCNRGEAGAFVEAGNTGLGGSLPVNTDGGACNVGRRHGANFCIEATRQLRHECGSRQVPSAEVALWANAVGFFSGAMLLTRG